MHSRHFALMALLYQCRLDNGWLVGSPKVQLTESLACKVQLNASNEIANLNCQQCKYISITFNALITAAHTTSSVPRQRLRSCQQLFI